MARPSYGSQAKKRAKRLFEALLAYSNDSLEDCESLSPYIQVNWQTDQQLVVRTKIRFLEALIAKFDDKFDDRCQISRDQLKEALKRFADFLTILEDNRPKTQGSEVWHFTLKLWHSRWNEEANLKRFDWEWEQRRSAQPLAPRHCDRDSPIFHAVQGRGDRRQDWGDAIDVSHFYGRSREINLLQNWVTDRCRLITILGMGGIGKTALVAKLAEQIQLEFDGLIWRSLTGAPPLSKLLTSLIGFLANQTDIEIPDSVEGQLRQLMTQLRQQRCLLVLDGFESVMQSGDRASGLSEEQESYSQFLKCLSETSHNSCVVITSREKPKGLVAYEGVRLPVRCLKLRGLSEAESRKLFQDKGSFAGLDGEWSTLTHRYAGNPLALKIVASTINEFCGGSLHRFLDLLRQDVFVCDDIRELLEQQFCRLTSLEREIMGWLATNCEPVSIEQLQSGLQARASIGEILQALTSLHERSLIEKELAPAQTPLVIEYIPNQLVTQALKATA